jgi:D-serine deaminase-like pyridoxal phosphate-dependent protein
MSTCDSLPTPYLAVDAPVLDRNIAEMADRADSLAIALRPHAKTHKSPEIARRQLAAGAVGLTVATAGEAEVFGEAGFDDLFIAYPLWADAAMGARLRALVGAATVAVGVDSAEGARSIAAQLPGARVLVEVDSGHHRTGVPPDDAGALAEDAQRAGLDGRGVFTFPGHSYAPGASVRVAEQEAQALGTAATSMSRHGVEAAVISGGSTPSAAQVNAGAMNEMRPGVYVFGDAQQWELGSIGPERVALTCAATVVSHAGDHVVLDSGGKALGADRAAWASGFGRLLDHPDARVVSLSEHHGVVVWDGSPRPPLGSRLRVVPNHVCNAVNLADELVVVDGGQIIDTWPVAARGANR